MMELDLQNLDPDKIFLHYKIIIIFLTLVLFNSSNVKV